MPAVQHASLAARPAGWQHGPPCANTAASAGDREPGVGDSNPLLEYTTVTHPITRTLTCTGTLWYESVDRLEKLELLRRYSQKV